MVLTVQSRGRTMRKPKDNTYKYFCLFLADESIQSTLSSDSYEYYQTEIFDLLPSVQASRSEQNRQGALNASEAHEGASGAVEDFSHSPVSRGPRDKTFLQPLRNLAMCMQAKRGAR